MVIERPLVSDSPMELEPLEEATPAKSTPVEAIPAEAMPIEDAHTEGRNGDASPMKEVYGETSTQIFCTTVLPWMPRFALCDREGGSSIRNNASS